MGGEGRKDGTGGNQDFEKGVGKEVGVRGNRRSDFSDCLFLRKT